MAGAAAGLAGLAAYPFGTKAIDSFLHPEKAFQAAEDQSQKYYVDAQGKLQPIVNNGISQFQRLNGQADALGNPVQLENQWNQAYTQSPQAAQAIASAKATGLDSAASQGLLGSSAALENIQKSAANIGQNDRQNYLNDLMQKYLASVGIGQNLYGVGANAAGQQSTNAVNQGNTQAGLAYGEQKAPGDILGNILGKAANAGINYATGGVMK